MEFHGYHGCLEHEKKDGNWFRVDLAFRYDMRDAIRTDCLEDAIDYSAIYQTVKEEMAKPANLLEHLAGRTLSAILDRFPAIEEAHLTVTKLNPPLDGKVESTSVTVDYE